MNFLGRAIKNVTRGLSKTVLLILTFFVIGNFVIVGLGVASATENAKTLTRQKMRAVVTYSVDYNKVWQYEETLTDEDEINDFYSNYPQVRYNDVIALKGDERISSINALSTTMAYAADNGIDFVHLNNSAEEDMEEYSGQSCYVGADGNDVCTNYVDPSFIIKGNFFDNMIEFADGDYSITSGRFYTEKEILNNASVALISEELAETNGLNVGDNISILIFSPDELSILAGQDVSTEDYTLSCEVIGIYANPQKITPDYSQFDYTYPYENPQNIILMPATTVYKAQLKVSQLYFDYYSTVYPDEEYYSDLANRPSEESITEMSLDTVTILLNDPLDVDQFVSDHSDDVGQFISLSSDNEEFETLSKPLDTLNLYANFIIWLVVINAIIIITLVTALTLKTREYEIGVLLSIGASKFKVIAQFFVELAIVALIGFTLSIASGSLIASKIGETMLEYQISYDGTGEEDEGYYWEDDYIDVWNTDYSTEITLDDLLAEYSVTVSLLIIGEIYVMGLGIVLVSILIPSMMIMRFNPKKILTNQG